MSNADRELRVKAIIDTSQLKSGINNVTQGTNKMKSSFGDMVKSTVSGATKLVDTLSQVSQSVNANDEMMRKLREEQNRLTNEQNIYKESLKSLDDTMKAYRDRIKQLTDAQEFNVDEIMETEERLAQCQEQYKELSQGLERTTNRLAEVTEEMENSNSSTQSLADVTKNLTGAWKEFNSGNFEKAFKKLVDAGKGLFILMPTWVKAIAGLVTALNGLAKAGQQRFFSGLSDMGNFFNPIIDGVVNAGRTIFNTFETITDSDFSFSGIIRSGVEFEDTMKRAGAICGATGAEYEKLEKKAREMGATTRYNATQSAEAMTFMGQAGWNATEISKGLEDVLNLATAGNIDLARSAEIVTNGLNAYGMGADEARKYVDVLAQASVKSGTDVDQFGNALENVAPMAHALSIDIEDTAVAVGLMGDNFIKSGKAGTSLKTFLANVSKPTKQMKKYIKDYNLETARQMILNGDLVGGYKEIIKQIGHLGNEEKNAIAVALAGKEGSAGFLSIINSGIDGINDLEKEIKDAEGTARGLREAFDETLKGGLMNLQSAIEERILQVFEKVEPVVTKAVDVINGFFNIWNGTSGMTDDRAIPIKGFADAVAYLESHIRASMPKISQFIQDGISNLNDFINGETFSNILQIGTNIIQAICDGIIKSYESGDLTEAITGFITKICDWIDTNEESIITAGKAIFSAIKTGITRNKDNLNDAMDSLYNIINMWVGGKKEVIATLGGTVGASLIEGLLKGLIRDAGTFIGEGFAFVINTIGQLATDFFSVGATLAWNVFDGFMNWLFDCGGWEGMKQGISDIMDWLWENDKGGVNSKAEDAGLTDGKRYGEKVDQGLKESKDDVSKTSNEIGTAMADGINQKLATMSTEQVEALGEEFENLLEKTQTTADGMRDAFGSIRNGARDSFVGMVNIIRNQCLNMTNIINNQTKNSRDEFCRQFMSMAKIAKQQMKNAYDDVSTYMEAIKNAVSKTLELKVNVSKTITTSYKDGNGEQSINALGTFSQLSAMARTIGVAPMSSMGLGTLVGTAVAQANNGTPIVIELVTNLDGKTVAQQTAQYMNNELKVIEKRKNRRNGN